MTSSHLIDAEQLLADQLRTGEPSLLRAYQRSHRRLDGAEADALCQSGLRERSIDGQSSLWLPPP